MVPETTQLPVAVSSPADVNRLLRELATIDDQLLQLGLRQGGTDVKLPKASRLLDQTIELNKLNLLQTADRLRLRQSLQTVHQRAPVLHISFGAEPSPRFMAQLMTWLRREIHPFVLVTTGLQPTIGAGCIVRTGNRSFDFSLAGHFTRQRDLLMSSLVGTAQAAAEQTRDTY